jgi:hypothetical protein
MEAKESKRASRSEADSSDLEQTVAKRILRSLQEEPEDPFVEPGRILERHEAHVPQRDRHVATPPGSIPALHAWAMQPLPTTPPAEAPGGFLSWLLLAGGLMTFTCGVVLLAWWFATGRAELWNPGLLLLAGGQAAVIFGLLGLAEAASHHQKALAEHRDRLTLMRNVALVTHAWPADSRRTA